MEDRNEQIAEFATKHNLTDDEAQLVYGDGTEENFAKNFALLKQLKTGKVRDDDLAKQSNDLLAQADEALKAGDTYKSIHLRRMAHGIQVR